MLPAVEARSPNHWTAREVPILFYFLKIQHDYILIHNQNTKYHIKLMAVKYGISFASHDEWLTSLVINEFLQTSDKDIDIPREMEKKKKTEENEITQVTSKD